MSINNVNEDIKKMEFLNLFVHLDELFYKVAKDGNYSITELVDRIDIYLTMNPFTKEQKEEEQVYKNIRAFLSANPSYGDMVVHDHPYENGNFNVKNDIVRANFFEENGNIYFSARGTGDGKWMDNAKMMVDESSLMQRATCEYFDKVMNELGYIPSSINLVGHSKGANDVLYEMMFSNYLMNLRKINPEVPVSCVALNAPGFSQAAIKAFNDKCKSNGINPDDVTKKMTLIIGSNDYVNWFGNRIVPDENIYVLPTPAAGQFGDIRDFGNYHALQYMNINGVPFAILYNEFGAEIDRVELKPLYKPDGTIDFELLGPLGKIGYNIQKLQLEMEQIGIDAGMDSEEWVLYVATVDSIMSIMERLLAKGFGIGDHHNVSEEDLRLFLDKGLPLFLDMLKSDPDLLKQLATEIFFTEKSDMLYLPPELADAALNGIIDLLSNIPSDKLANLLVPILCGIESDEITLAEILKAIDFADLLALIPYITEWGKENSDLLFGLLEHFGVNTYGIGPDQFNILLDALSFISNSVDADVIKQALIGAINDDGKLDISKIDWKLLITAMSPEQLVIFIKKYAPELLKSIKDNPELLSSIHEILPIPNWLGSILLNPFSLDVLATAISWLPQNILTGLIDGLVKGLTTGDWKQFAIDFITLGPALGIAAIKNAFEFIVEQAKQFLQATIDKITSKINAGIDFIGDIVNGALDLVSGLFDAGMNLISGVSSIATQFGVDVLDTLKNTLPPQFSGVFERMENVIKFIDSAVQDAANVTKKILQVFKDALKSTVDSIVSGTQKAINAFGDFISDMAGKSADVVKGLGSAACDAVGKTWKLAAEFAWDSGKYIGRALVTAGKKSIEYIKTIPRAFNFDGNPILDPIATFFSNIDKCSLSPKQLISTIAPIISNVTSMIGSGAKVALSLSELQQLQKSMADLISIWQSTFRVSQDSYIMANNASRDYKQTYVHNAANAVRTLCNNIDNSQNDVYRELLKINEGLLQTISGYRELEARFN